MKFQFASIPKPVFIRRALCAGVLSLALSAAAVLPAGYTIQFGTGVPPFQYDLPPVDYSVTATGTQNHQGVHGFDLQHSGADTVFDLPGENYFIDLLQVNARGQVAGTFNANYGGSGCHAFFWDQGQLSIFSGLADTHVEDMNDSGLVIGTSLSRYGSRQGFILDHGSYATFNLSTYLQQFQYNGQSFSLTHGESTLLTDINDQGEILGNFSVSGRPEHFWFIASPVSVPEPGALSLLGVGIFGLLTIRGRTSILSRRG